MSEILSELVRVREKYEVTLPKELRETLKLVPGDYLGFDRLDSGHICIHKIIPHRMRNANNTCQVKNNGGEDGKTDTST